MTKKIKEPEDLTFITKDPKPYTCPICHGEGIVALEFYGYSSSSPTEKCRTCMGIGIVWGQWSGLCKDVYNH